MIDRSLLITDPKRLIRYQVAESKQGVYAWVYYTHDKNVMLKHAPDSSDGWIMWALYSIFMNARWMPKIHQMVFDVYDEEDMSVWARMERLYVPKGENAYYMRESKTGKIKVDPWFLDEPRSYDNHLSHYVRQKMYETEEDYYSRFGLKPIFDLHHTNWMIRKGKTQQHVITDPWASHDLSLDVLMQFAREMAVHTDRVHIKYRL